MKMHSTRSLFLATALAFAGAAVAAPPANDLCSAVTAVPLSIGTPLTFTGDNTEATFIGDAAPGTLMADYPFPNTWHAFTTAGCTDVTISYCGTSAGWSNVWKLLTTDCPAQTLINATASNTTDCANGNWTFSFSSLPAGTYYLPVPNVGFGQGGGPYSIQVTAATCASAPPANDLCSAVTPQPLAIDASLTFTGDNTNATFAGDAAPGTVLADYPFPNTWHAFTTTDCADVTVSYCGTSAGWSIVWRLLTTDCPAQTLINATTESAGNCANGNWTFTFSSLPAGTYYLPVPNVGFGQGGGAYSIDVSAAACANVVPANDLCSAVTPGHLSAGGSLTFNGNNTLATFAGDAEPGTVLADYPFPNTWHAFTTDACTDVTVSYCATDAGWTTVWKLLTTDCPAQTIINATAADDTTCANGNWTFTFSSLPAGTYYLPVPNVGFGQGGGAYRIEVTAATCANAAPANDLCADVTPVEIAAGTALTFEGDNTHATFAGDAEPGTILADFPSPNTWHAFTTTDCLDLTFSYCNTPEGWTNVWKLLTTDCPAHHIINATAANDTACANGNWTFSFTDLQPGTYYLPVPNVGFGQGGGHYSIEVDAVTCLHTGIAGNQAAAQGWNLYPNPADGTVAIATPQGMGGVQIDIVDLSGRTAYSEHAVLAAGGTRQINLAGRVVAGAYTVVITSAEGRSCKGLVVR